MNYNKLSTFCFFKVSLILKVILEISALSSELTGVSCNPYYLAKFTLFKLFVKVILFFLIFSFKIKFNPGS